MRIVSLLPGATEVVFALEIEPVGVSHECDYPPATADIPAVTHSSLDGSSTEDVEAQVQTARKEGGSVFEIDVERLENLEPDLVVTQATCEVCAVDASIVQSAVDASEVSPSVLAVDPHTVDGVLTMTRRIGEAAGRQEEASRLIASLSDRLDAIGEAVPDEAHRPSVAILDWLSPVMVAGHWVPELVHLAGGQYPLADPGSASRVRDWAEVSAADPEVLIAVPCGLDLEETRSDAHHLTSRAGWSSLTAVQTGEVYAMDGNAFLNRPGPRIVEAAEYLAAVLHPTTRIPPPASAMGPLIEPAAKADP